jgi:secernin
MCDTWVALRDATTTQQVIFAKNSHRPIFDCQPLMLYPAQDWPAGSQIQTEYVTLPQAEHTYATLGSSPYWSWGYEEGINEHGVVIGNEAIFTKTFKQLASARVTEPGLTGMDLIRLGLERSRTAQQAVEVIGQFVEQYGQFGSGVPAQSHVEGGYDNAFIIADSSEAWTLEAVGTRWAARRFTAGSTSISNQPTIRDTWDAGSDDLETYARQQGWWPEDTPLDFARAYIDDQKPRHLSHIRLTRSRQLLAECSGRITPEWMKRIARDHYEDTFLGGPYFDAADPDFLSICMHASPANFTWGNTASSCVAILPKSSGEIPIFWWTPGPPCNGCYVPFFPQGSRLPEIVSAAGTFGKRVAPPPEIVEDEFSAESYWWLFRRLMDSVKGGPVGSKPGLYPARNQMVRQRFDALEAEFAAQLPQVVTSAVNDDGVVKAAALDDFTAACVERVVETTRDLLATFD